MGESPKLAPDPCVASAPAVAVQLNSSESSFRDFLQSLPSPAFVVEPATSRILCANDAAVRQYGYSSAEFHCMHFLDLHIQEERPLVAHWLQGEITNREIEYQHVTREGEQRLVNLQLHPCRAGETPAVCVLANEVRHERTPQVHETEARELLENASDIIYSHDLQGRFLTVNSAATEITGYSEAEALAMNITDLLPPEDVELARAAIESKLHGQHIRTPYHLRVRTRDGRTLVMEVNTRLLYRGGKPYAVQGIAREITERWSADQALRESEAKFRAVAETATVAIFIYQDNRLRYVNPASVTITGYSVEELTGIDFWELARPDFRELVRSRSAARQRGQAVPTRYELAIRTKSGGEVWFDFSATLIQYEGRPAVLAMGADVTERKRAEIQLGVQKAYLEQLIDSAPEAIVIINLQNTVMRVNREFTRLFGYSAQEACGRNIDALIVPEDKAGESRWLEEIAAENRTYSLYTQRLRKDGELVDVCLLVTPIQVGGGQVAMYCIYRDVTVEKSAQDALRRSEEHFRLLVETSLDLITILAPDRSVRYMSPSVSDLLQREAADMIGRDLHEFVHPEDVAVAEALFVASMGEERKGGPAELRLQHRDGRWLPFEVISNGMRDESGAALGVMASCRDLTDRKRAEQQLRDSQERLALHMEQTPLGVIEWDRNGKIKEWNPAAERIFGYSSAHAIGKGLELIVDDDDIPIVVERARRTLESKATSGTNYNRTRSGQRIFCEWYNTPLVDSAGNVIGVASMVLEMTERKRAEQALSESESKFRVMADTATSAFYIHDAERFLYVNRACQEITGYSSEELLSMSPFSIVHPAYRKAVQERSEARRLGESVMSRFEFPIITKGGETRWLSFSGSPFLFEGREALLAAAFDISERKRAEQLQSALYRIADQASSAEDLDRFYRSIHTIVGELMDARNFYIALLDEPTETLEFVYAVDEADNYPAEPIALGERGLTEYVLRTGQPQLVDPDRFNALVAAGEVNDIGEPSVDWLGVPLKHGQTTIGIVAVQSYTEAIRFGEKEKEILTFVSQHLATALERKRSEEALRQSELRYRSMVQSAVYGIYRSSVDDRFLDVNPALLNMLGYDSAAELLQVSISRDVYVDREERHRILGEYADKGVIEGLETRWKRKDGRVIAVRLSGRAIRNSQGHTEALETIVEDITERRALEDQLRQSQKMEAVGRLAGGIAHDFNNLLTVIKGYSELMLDEISAGDPMRAEVEEVRKAADRAAALTRQLLAFSRQQVLAPKILDLNASIANMQKLLRRLLGEDVHLVTLLEPALGRVKADPGQVEQVLMNLAVNARDAMPRGGRLTIETANVDVAETHAADPSSAKPGPYVMFRVSDTGSGMSEEVRARVFEPFFTTKEMGKGTGLGLSTVYGIVKQSGGHISVTSSEGTGTAFTILLPRIDSAADPATRKRPEAKPLGTETILLVEDEDGVRAFVRQVLQKNGYSVIEARHGGEALLLCERFQGTIHLLLTDVVLEQMSGRELAERLGPLRPEMKVLYISGYTADAVVHHGVQASATAFLQKPFTAEALARKIREVIQGIPGA